MPVTPYTSAATSSSCTRFLPVFCTLLRAVCSAMELCSTSSNSSSELDGLRARSIQTDDRIGISGRAHLLLDYHKRLDQASEQRRGAGKIGTTGRGIGPAYEDKIARVGVRVADLMNPERARELLQTGTERANEKLRQADAEALDPQQVIDGVFSVADRLLPLIAETGQGNHAGVKGEQARSARGCARFSARRRSRHLPIRDVIDDDCCWCRHWSGHWSRP